MTEGGWIPSRQQFEISSQYGKRTDPVTGKAGTMHNGVDFKIPVGTKLAAPTNGIVVYAGTGKKGSGYNNYGNVVAIRDGNGNVHLYGHMDKVNAYVGQMVTPGMNIGTSGNTGKSTGPHLHYEVRRNGKLGDTLDPMQFLR